MLIKVADDKSKRLKFLEELQRSTHLSFPQKNWLRQQSQSLSPGPAGERDAAYYLDKSLSANKTFAVLHDLRLEADGQIAHIDHLVVDQALACLLIETQTYKGNVYIDERGGFMVEFAGEAIRAIESPLEHSRSHETVLNKVLARLGISQPAGIQPRFAHVVMIHPKGMIDRADPKAFDSSMVIKADQFSTWHKAFVGKNKPLEVSADLLDGGAETRVKEWGALLKAEHCPINPLELPDFMKSVILPEKLKAAVPQVCVTCGKKISPKVAKYCADMMIRFGGRLYCYEHQADKK